MSYPFVCSPSAIVDFPAPGIPVKQTINFGNNNYEKWLVYEGNGDYYKEVKEVIIMRTFVAVEISNEQIIDKISKFQSKLKINAKPVEPHNLHFTLKFLGEISDLQHEKIKHILEKIEFSRFMIEFKGIGVFPKPTFPRVIWIGTDDVGGTAVIKFAKKIEDSLLTLGFKSDKPFRPHITIFRIKNKSGDIMKDLEGYTHLDFGTQEITSFKFKQSTLTPNGPIYSDLLEVKARL